MRTLLKTSALIATALFVTAVSASEPVSTSGDGVAAGGHDVTAYKNLNRGGDAVSGNASFAAQYKGATWHFVRREDRDKFNENPEKFSPAFNGHCANALALGEGLIPTSALLFLCLPWLQTLVGWQSQAVLVAGNRRLESDYQALAISLRERVQLLARCATLNVFQAPSKTA